MTKKKEKEDVKFIVKKRAPKEKPNYFQNLTPFKHPVTEIFEQANLIPVEQPISSLEIIEAKSLDTTLPIKIGVPDPAGTPEPTGQPIKSGVPIKIDPAKQKRIPKQTGQPQKTDPTSPVRDFTKTPNSLISIILAQGLFRGKSKHIYDYLWKQSRGHIKPSRTIQLTNKQIKDGTGLGSKNTVAEALRHLEQVGLIRKNITQGETLGNTYEIFTPEEIGVTNLTGIPIENGMPNESGIPTQKVGYLGYPESGMPSSDQIDKKSTTYDHSKTFFKTLKYIDDYAPVNNVLEKLNEMAQKLTGKNLTKKDLDNLSDVTEILINETIIAAARTGTVSAAVAFMTENLRRRLYSKARPAGKKETRPKHLDIGKGSGEEISLVPQSQTLLSEEQRENTLSALREAKETDSIFFREFKTYGEIEYTPEDFKWLMDNLEKGSY